MITDNDRVLDDGTVRGFQLYESHGAFEVVPYTKPRTDGRRYFYHDCAQRFAFNSLCGSREHARNLALVWGRQFRDHGWAK
jgi:hypothetical protein